MGAALHLAHAHQLPAPPKRKRKGGGGNGNDFYEYAQRIYSDDRADPDARSLLLAVAFAVTSIRDDGPAQWDLVRGSLGEGPRGKNLVRYLIERDVPRYIAPDRKPASHDNLLQICAAPRIRPYRTHPRMSWTPEDIAAQARRDEEDFRNVHGICGEGTTDHVVEKLSGTGWHKLHYFCQRHRDHLLRVRAQVAESNKLAPEPIPNSGGLLPSYFDADWVKCYQHYRGEHWQPPVYGVRADDWPTPGREIAAPRTRLRLAAMDGELLAGPVE